MAEAETKTEETAGEQTLQGGAYEVLKKRLADQSDGLRKKIDQLNERRKEIFGGTETTLVDNVRVKTEHACVPRDIRHLGNKMIIGYEVFLGMKKEIEVTDVFSVYQFKSIGLLKVRF